MDLINLVNYKESQVGLVIRQRDNGKIIDIQEGFYVAIDSKNHILRLFPV